MNSLPGCFRLLRANFFPVGGVLCLVLAGFAPGLRATQEDRPESAAGAFLTPEPLPAEALAAQASLSYDALAEASAGPAAVGPIAPAPGQPSGALSGRIVFAGARHGWVYDPSAWRLCRPEYAGINEDNGNLDQMTLFAFYCFNAGATVVPLRPVGHQTNEVVLDNDSAGVTWSGAWSDTSDTVFYGSAGDVPSRSAAVSDTESATATYTPNIPLTGFYPVYTWVTAGSDRTNQLYRIRHTGGEALVRVPHHMVGNGWVYLGTYYFAAGANSADGAVLVSNLGPVPGATGVVIADAIRFGNGMGSIARGGKVSTYPREEEATRYWVQNSLGQGQSSEIYDIPGSNDETDDFGTTARMAREMNYTNVVSSMYKRIYIGFHSNATSGNTNTATARGTVGLYNSNAADRTPNQVWLATACGQEVTYDLTSMNAFLEVPWHDRSPYITYGDGSYAEINTANFSGEMDATIIEVAFHDNTEDIKLLLDPKARNWVARAAYHAVVKYMNKYDGLALNFLPEPPYSVRAVAVPTGVQISWNTPLAQAGSGAATGYVVYVSTNGYGFGSPVAVGGGGTTSTTLTTLPADADYYFRVAAVNNGGQSFPSEVVGCRRASNPAQSRVLFVNAFDRFDRTTNLRQDLTKTNYVPPGNTGATGRVMPQANNAFDYVVQHGKAISAFGMPFDSCSRQAVTSAKVSLGNYDIVVWECGTSLTNTFRSVERSFLNTFRGAGGHLFVSGADIGWDLDRATGPAAADRAFLNNALHADLGADANNNSGSYTVSPAGGTIFAGSGDATFDNGTNGIYWVQNPDALTPLGAGASAALSYVGGSGGTAAVQYDGSAGGGKVVYFGFPFETITNATTRSAYMADILRFFSKPARFEAIAWLPDRRPQVTLSAEPGLVYTVLVSSNLTSWETLTNLPNVSGSVSFVDDAATNAPQRFYRAELVP
ncbi:MAG TPA: fibronectin type III domain-containing protein [Candidatus Paceibacterota bacterium]|nr:fibronectin type III domain-containing protein [Verrucomicrobiota bacterium]HSA11600.1 fibronectin type III domain-containing protein [Candidatus Paceibacterota bacterium]